MAYACGKMAAYNQGVLKIEFVRGKTNRVMISLSRNARALLCLVITLVGCDSKSERPVAARNPPTPQSCGSSVITGNGIGDLAIGTPVDSVKQLCHVLSDTIELDNEAMPSRLLLVAVDGDTVKAEIDSGKVWRIQIVTQKLRTADSLGVGSTLARMLDLREPKGWWGEGAVFLVSPQHCGLSFQLSAKSSDVPAGDLDRNGLLRLSKATVVTRVLIVGCDSVPRSQDVVAVN